MRSSPALYGLPLLLVVAACSGKVVIGENGTNTSQFRKNADGSCSYGNTKVELGKSIPSPDGCNTCTCSESGAVCTEMACAQDGGVGGGGTCSFEGKTYAKGQSFKCPDGCNTCTCTEDGSIAQTEMACVNDCSAPNACGPAPGAPSRVCVDGTTAGPACKQTNAGQCGWQFTTCTCDDGAGKKYKPGETFKTACNTCGCQDDGSVICTAEACTCPPSGTVIDCEPPTNTKPLCEGPEHDWLVANCPGVTFAL